MAKHNILVTGGAGFIGAQVTLELLNKGHNVTVVDRDQNRANIVSRFGAKTIIADFPDIDYKAGYDTVIHLAADHKVEESVSQPLKYYTNNIIRTKQMLDRMVTVGIKNIIFSSSGAVYGEAESKLPIPETAKYSSSCTYASTKIAGELLIRDYSKAYNLNYVTFRYFNAAGADSENRIGYTQVPATHVLPILCNKIKNGETFTIFGKDYNTVDGTCVRDYIHVVDIARAHSAALDFLDTGNKNETFNLGGPQSFTVRQLVEQVGNVVGKYPIIEYADRRPGDPAMLIGDISKAKNMLNWEPKYNITDMIRHAWTWELRKE